MESSQPSRAHYRSDIPKSHFRKLSGPVSGLPALGTGFKRCPFLTLCVFPKDLPHLLANGLLSPLPLWTPPHPEKAVDCS